MVYVRQLAADHIYAHPAQVGPLLYSIQQYADSADIGGHECLALIWDLGELRKALGVATLPYGLLGRLWEYATFGVDFEDQA
jgi:hypothetical protein